MQTTLASANFKQKTEEKKPSLLKEETAFFY